MSEPIDDSHRAGLVERERALARLGGARFEPGEPTLVVVEAAAGLGKSALLDVVAADAQAAGVMVARAAGLAVESDLPLALAARLLAPLVEASGLTPIDPDGPFGPAGPLFEDGVATEVRPEITVALSRLLSHLAEDRQLTLIVDDAHWADAPTVAFLRFVAARVDPERVALVLATRPERSGTTARELEAVAALRRARVVTLEPLSVTAVGRLLRQELPAASPDAAAACHTITGGNPLFVREVINVARAEPDPGAVAKLSSLSLTMAALPTVTARLDRLSASARALAQAAAVLGGGFELEHAASIAELDDADAAKAVAELEGAAILSGDPPAFAHSLIERSVATTTGPAVRRRLHERAVTVLRAARAHPIVVARHLLEVEPRREPVDVDLLLDASRLAHRAGEPSTALTFAERAVAEPPAEDQRRRVLAEIARTAASAGDPRWRRLTTAAVDAAPDRAPRLLEAIGRDLMGLSRLEEATEAYSWGLHVVRDAPVEHLRLLGRFVHSLRGNVERPGDHLELVDQLAEAVDAYPDRDTPEWRQAAAFLAYQRTITVSTFDDVDALVSEALDPARVTEREVLEAIPFFTAVQAAGQVGADAEGGGIEWALQIGTDLDAPTVVQVALAYRGGRRLREGRIDEAVDDFERAGRQRPQVPLTVPKLHSELALARLEQGRIDDARTVLEAVDSEVYRTTGFYNAYLRTRALVNAAAGELERALDDLLACGEREAMVLVPGAIAIPWAFDAAVVLVELGRRDEAAEWLVEPLEAARRQGAPFRVAHGLRALAATQPDDAAETSLREARDALDGTPWDLERRAVEVALARLLLRTGDRQQAGELLRGVVDRAHRVGATRIGQTALELLRGSGARPRRLAVTGPESLTPGERAVVKLAVDGLTNREIADERGVSVKAVEHALSNAYRKLGVSSRHELR